MTTATKEVVALLRPEHALLLSCSRTELDSIALERVKKFLREKLDWDHLFSFGRRHGLLSVFFAQINKVSPDLVPSAELARLKLHYNENIARNQVLTNELSLILHALADSQIEAIPYKGPALAAYAYGNLAYRRFLDLDVMVRKADVSGAMRVLTGMGYSAGKEWTEAQEDLLLRTQHNLQFTKDDKRLIVELHWEVASELFARSLQAETLWDRLVPLELNGETVKTLAPEDLLLSLCVHGSKHMWERLSWICDVAELVRSHPEIDWQVVFERAGTGEKVRMLKLGLMLARTLFDAPFKESINFELSNDGNLVALLDDTCRRIFGRGEQELIPLNENLRFNLKLRGSWESRLRYLRMVFRPTDADVGAVSLPARLSFGYYLLRPFRFLQKRRNDN